MKLPMTVAAAFLVAACAGPATSPPGSSQTGLVRAQTPPVWVPGDRWVYRWTSGAERSTRTVEMLEVKELNGVRYFVVRNADAHHYWTSDLHWAGTVRATKVEARMVPPAPWFVWPLEIGRRWTHHGTYEDSTGKREATEVFVVEAVEPIEVPAGRFTAVKIVREGTEEQADQYWYVPEVRSYVRWSGRRGNFEFDEQLIEYRPAPRAGLEAPGSPAASPTR